jgi:hypothetical protein
MYSIVVRTCTGSIRACSALLGSSRGFFAI